MKDNRFVTVPFTPTPKMISAGTPVDSKYGRQYAEACWYGMIMQYEQDQKDAKLSDWEKAYAEARLSHAAGEPLIRTVCKIATRILFVLLVVGLMVVTLTACERREYRNSPAQQVEDYAICKAGGMASFQTAYAEVMCTPPEVRP